MAMSIDLLRAARAGDVDALLRLSGDDGRHNVTVSIPMAKAGGSPAPSPSPRILLLGATAEGNTALHVAASLGHTKFVEELRAMEPSLLGATNSRGETALHLAARAGHRDAVACLLTHREGVRARNRGGETALHEAARMGCEDVAAVLVGADHGLVSVVDDAGVSALYLAAMAGSVGVVRAILHHEDSRKVASCSGPDGRTALHAAVSHSTGITKLLLEWNPELVREADSSRSIPLHYVCSTGNSKMADLLLNCDTSTAHMRDKDGFTPVHIAAAMGCVELIRILIKHCPDCDELLDSKGRTFLHSAADNDRPAVVKYVLGISELQKLLNYRDSDGNTALHLSVSNGSGSVVYQLAGDKRVELSIMNNNGSTPLDIAFSNVQFGTYYFMNARSCIIRCLSDCGALTSPSRRDREVFQVRATVDEELEMKRQQSWAKNGAIASVLIATVAFAVAFTMPGGYVSNGSPHEGTAILARSRTFKAFIISDAFAMVFSIIATVQIIHASAIIVDNSIRANLLVSSHILLWLAFECMVITFGMGAYAALAQESRATGIIVCIIVLSAPFVNLLFNRWSILVFMRAIASRRGIVGGIIVHLLPHASRRAGPYGKASLWLVFLPIVWFLSLFAVIYALALF